MTIKILAFGESQHLNQFIQQSKNTSLQNSEENIVVQNVTIADIQYLLFAVKERALVAQQSTGTNGLIFFIGSETPLFEEKQYLVDLLSSKPEFDNIPIAVIFQKGQRLTLKDVVNYMELYRFKDRASMIKQIAWNQPQWIPEIYSWIKNQSQNLKGKGFHAAPKVVKIKPKYRQITQLQSQKKYEEMLDQKQLRSLGVKQQQQVYIQREKDKIKQDNMEKQLSNFSKNKKKMAPYDIKPTPNPKIQPNLHFFLKDPNAKPPTEASIKIQTDQFKQRNPPPPYKPKKTGINISTQIQKNELFSFDKQVRPILAILTTKALETAALQIQEEEQLTKMSKYKMAYEQRVKKQKEHQQKNIDEQLKIMKQKEKLLSQHKSRAQKIKNIQYRTQCYSIANNFLENIYFKSTSKLIIANAYPDQLNNFLHLDYLNQIMNKTVVAYDAILNNQSALKNVFDQQVIQSITKVANNSKIQRSRIQKVKQNRLSNKVSSTRRFHILYKHDYPQFSNFTKYLSRHFDGTIDQYSKTRQQQIQQMSDKNQNGQVTEQQLLKFKMKDNITFGDSGHQCFVLNNHKQLCFTWTSNRYEKSAQQYLENNILLLDKQGQIIDDLIAGKITPKHESFLRNQEGLRQPRESINTDHGYALNLAKVPQNVKTIVFLVKISQIQKFKNQLQAKKVKNSAYGVQFWQRNIKIHNKNIGQGLKWEQIIKSVQGQQIAAQDLYIVSYVLRRRVINEYWNLQDLSYTAQPIKSNQQFNHFLEELSRFYYRSQDFLKQQEEDQKTQRATSSQQKKPSNNQRIKSSKKVIEEQPKKIIVLKVSNRIMRQIEINLDQPFENVIKKITGVIEQWKQFMQSSENGWEILVKGEKLTSVHQLSKVTKLGEITLKKIPKIDEPKIQKIEQVEKQQIQQ